MLRLFENRVHMETLSPKTEEQTGGWGKLHNMDL
jgi:hypothetical protein